MAEQTASRPRSAPQAQGGAPSLRRICTPISAASGLLQREDHTCACRALNQADDPSPVIAHSLETTQASVNNCTDQQTVMESPRNTNQKLRLSMTSQH